MRLSEWQAVAPSPASVAPKVLEAVESVLLGLGADADPTCWVAWGDDPAIRYTILALAEAGLVICHVRVNVPQEGPRVGGKLAQMATPSELLTSPADEFVADFVGRDRGYRSLGFTNVAGTVTVSEEAVVQLGASATEAQARASGAWVLVVDGERKPLGWAQPELIAGELKRDHLNLSGTSATSAGTPALSCPNIKMSSFRKSNE